MERFINNAIIADHMQVDFSRIETLAVAYHEFAKRQGDPSTLVPVSFKDFVYPLRVGKRTYQGVLNSLVLSLKQDRELCNTQYPVHQQVLLRAALTREGLANCIRLIEDNYGVHEARKKSRWGLIDLGDTNIGHRFREDGPGLIRYNLDKITYASLLREFTKDENIEPNVLEKWKKELQRNWGTQSEKCLGSEEEFYSAADDALRIETLTNAIRVREAEVQALRHEVNLKDVQIHRMRRGYKIKLESYVTCVTISKPTGGNSAINAEVYVNGTPYANLNGILLAEDSVLSYDHICRSDHPMEKDDAKRALGVLIASTDYFLSRFRGTKSAKVSTGVKGFANLLEELGYTRTGVRDTTLDLDKDLTKKDIKLPNIFKKR